MVDPIIFIIIAVLGVGLGIKVTSTRNPVYSGLYLVLLFFLGSAISFILGLEFMALLFILVYAGAIAVLVLFVVMMLDVKAVENSWSAEKKRLFYFFCLFFATLLTLFALFMDLPNLMKTMGAVYMSSLLGLPSPEPQSKNGSLLDIIASIRDGEAGVWFVEFDSSSSISDLSYLLYATHAILLLIAGIILLIAMVGAITLTLQKNCPESLHRQLGRESRNAVFGIKEKKPSSKKLP